MLVALNSVFQVVAFAALGWFYLSVSPGGWGSRADRIDASTWDIARSVLLFLGIPLLAGYLSRRVGEKRRGREWYEATFIPRVAPWALYGLLFTIVILFALQGEAITLLTVGRRPDRTAAARLLRRHVGRRIRPRRRSRAGLPRRRRLAFTAAGNNFELAIAVAIATFGAASGEALAGVVGPLIEVPALVALSTSASPSDAASTCNAPLPTRQEHLDDRQAQRSLRLRAQRRAVPDGRRLPRAPCPRGGRGPVRRLGTGGRGQPLRRGGDEGGRHRHHHGAPEGADHGGGPGVRRGGHDGVR